MSNPHAPETYHEAVCRHDGRDEAAAHAGRMEQGMATWAQAGFRAPVTHHEAQPVHVIRDPEA